MANVTNVVSKKRENTATRIIEALKENKGLLTKAAVKAGVSYRTINRYVNEFPLVAEAVHEAKESLLDKAESKLFDAVDKGEAWAICFYLKTQGKDRHYSEKQVIEHTGETTIRHCGEINIDTNTITAAFAILRDSGAVRLGEVDPTQVAMEQLYSAPANSEAVGLLTP